MKGFKLKIALDNSKPKVTRTVAVPEYISFADLHRIIQTVMEWDDYHLHVFEVGGRTIGMDPNEGEEPEEIVPVSQFRGMKIRYNYDFGDNWWVTISWLKDIEDYDSDCARLLKWTERSPPEDCGGVWGFSRYLAALDDPDDEEHETAEEIIADFDEEAVSVYLELLRLHGADADSRPLNMMAQNEILKAMCLPLDEPLAFDKEMEMPVLIKKTSDGKKTVMPYIDERTLESEPDRFVPLDFDYKTNTTETVRKFLKNKKGKWPEATRDNLNEIFGLIEKKGLIDEYIEFEFEQNDILLMEWAEKNGYYLTMPGKDDIIQTLLEMAARDNVDISDPDKVKQYLLDALEKDMLLRARR